MTRHKDAPLDVRLVHSNSAGAFSSLEENRARPASKHRPSILDQVASISEQLGPLPKLRRASVRDDEKDEAQGNDIEQMMKAFAYFDVNGDGVIDYSEFLHILQSLDADLFTDEHVEKLIAEADVNGDGEIHYAEFVAWLCNEDTVVASRVLATATISDLVPGHGPTSPIAPPSPVLRLAPYRFSDEDD